MNYPNRQSALSKLNCGSERNESNCQIWQGKKTHNGYGEVHLLVEGKYKLFRTNRVACWLKDPIAFDLYSSLQALHSCDNRACCNQDHIYPGTPKQNVLDREDRYYGKV